MMEHIRKLTIGVEHLGCEANFWSFVRVLIAKCQTKREDAACEAQSQMQIRKMQNKIQNLSEARTFPWGI